MQQLIFDRLNARRVVKILAALVSCTLITLYILFQSRNFLLGPQIILEPLPSVQHRTTVALTGNTRNITYLSLNGKQIYTDESGTFSHELVLENGYTIMTLYAMDRFGRTTNLSRPFVYVPASVY